MSLIEFLAKKTEDKPKTAAAEPEQKPGYGFEWQGAPRPVTFRDHIRKAIEEPWPKREAVTITEDYLFRASHLHEDCPRQKIIMMREGIPEIGEVDFATGWIYGIGTAIHEFLQSVVFAPIACGEWKCDGCGNYVLNQGGGRCSCGSKFRYQEDLLEKEGVTGHPDQIWDVSEIGRGVAEFKTMNSTSFGNLVAPKPEHITQINVYFWLTGLTQGWIVYCSKEFGNYDDTLKFFEVKRDEAIIEVQIAKVKAFHESLKTGDLPRKRKGCRGGGGCPVREICKKVN